MLSSFSFLNSLFFLSYCTSIRTHTHSLTHTYTYILTRTPPHSYCRLCAARDMSLSMSSGAETDPRSNGEDETVGEMDVVLESTPSGEVISSTQRHKNSSSKPPYQAFLGQLYALIEGAIDSNRLVCTHINTFTHSASPPPSFDLTFSTTFTFLFPDFISFCLPHTPLLPSFLPPSLPLSLLPSYPPSLPLSLSLPFTTPLSNPPIKLLLL